MASSLINLNLAKRTPVEHWESHSQSAHKRATPHSQSGAASCAQICSSAGPVPELPLYWSESFDIGDNNATGNNKGAAAGALSAGGACHRAATTFGDAGQRDPRVSLWVPATASLHVLHLVTSVATLGAGPSLFTTRDKCRSPVLVPSPKIWEGLTWALPAWGRWPLKVGHYDWAPLEITWIKYEATYFPEKKELLFQHIS